MSNYEPEVSQATHDAEEALLGALLIEGADSGDRTAIDEVAKIVQPEDFLGYYSSTKPEVQPLNSRVFRAMVSCAGPPHQINTASEMERLGILTSGDCSYLCHLVSIIPCSLDYLDYARAVKKYAVKRKVSYLISKDHFDEAARLLSGTLEVKGGAQI